MSSTVVWLLLKQPPTFFDKKNSKSLINIRLFGIFMPILLKSAYFRISPDIFLFNLDFVLFNWGKKYWGNPRYFLAIKSWLYNDQEFQYFRCFPPLKSFWGLPWYFLAIKSWLYNDQEFQCFCHGNTFRGLPQYAGISCKKQLKLDVKKYWGKLWNIAVSLFLGYFAIFLKKVYQG